MPYLNFQAIKSEHSIEDIVQMLGLKMKRESDQYRMLCPRCNAGGNRSLAVTPSKQSFYCFAAKTGGDLISLCAHIEDVSMKDAAHLIVEHFDTPPHKAEVTPPTRTEGGTNRSTFSPLDYLVFSHPLLVAHDLDEGLAEKLGIGFSPKGLMKGLIAIPLRLETGELVGYAGVSEAKFPKTFHFPDTNVVTFPKKRA